MFKIVNVNFPRSGELGARKREMVLPNCVRGQNSLGGWKRCKDRGVSVKGGQARKKKGLCAIIIVTVTIIIIIMGTVLSSSLFQCCQRSVHIVGEANSEIESENYSSFSDICDISGEYLVIGPKRTFLCSASALDMCLLCILLHRYIDIHVLPSFFLVF